MILYEFIRAKGFERRVSALGMTDQDEREIERRIAADVEAGDMIPGCAGARTDLSPAMKEALYYAIKHMSKIHGRKSIEPFQPN